MIKGDATCKAPAAAAPLSSVRRSKLVERFNVVIASPITLDFSTPSGLSGKLVRVDFGHYGDVTQGPTSLSTKYWSKGALEERRRVSRQDSTRCRRCKSAKCQRGEHKAAHSDRRRYGR